MTEYHSIKWIDRNTATRLTREVRIKCTIIDHMKFEKDGEIINGVGIQLEGTADIEHHIVEDAAILLKKMCEVKCGVNHD